MSKDFTEQVKAAESLAEGGSPDQLHTLNQQLNAMPEAQLVSCLQDMQALNRKRLAADHSLPEISLEFAGNDKKIHGPAGGELLIHRNQHAPTTLIGKALDGLGLASGPDIYVRGFEGIAGGGTGDIKYDGVSPYPISMHEELPSVSVDLKWFQAVNNQAPTFESIHYQRPNGSSLDQEFNRRGDVTSIDVHRPGGLHMTIDQIQYDNDHNPLSMVELFPDGHSATIDKITDDSKTKVPVSGVAILKDQSKVPVRFDQHMLWVQD